VSSTRIGFSTTPNLSSWLLRKLTGSSCSHTFLFYVDQDWDIAMVMEAHETGYRLVPFARFEQENTVVRLVNPEVPIEDGVRWSALHLGSAYGYSKLFGMALVLLGRIFRKRWKNPGQDSHSMFCSEMTVRILQQSGYPGAERLVATETTPQDLLDFFTR